MSNFDFGTQCVLTLLLESRARMILFDVTAQLTANWISWRKCWSNQYPFCSPNSSLLCTLIFPFKLFKSSTLRNKTSNSIHFRALILPFNCSINHNATITIFYLNTLHFLNFYIIYFFFRVLFYIINKISNCLRNHKNRSKFGSATSYKLRLSKKLQLLNTKTDLRVPRCFYIFYTKSITNQFMWILNFRLLFGVQKCETPRWSFRFKIISITSSSFLCRRSQGCAALMHCGL
jgi:hypothetical protein